MQDNMLNSVSAVRVNYAAVLTVKSSNNKINECRHQRGKVGLPMLQYNFVKTTVFRINMLLYIATGSQFNVHMGVLLHVQRRTF